MMKKVLSLLITFCILLSAVPVFAETVIELDSLRYDEYMFEETVIVSGYANTYVILSLFYPEEYGSTAKFMMTYSPDQLRDGIEIALGEKSNLWPEGLWTIVVNSGETNDALEFTLTEFVDRTEEEPSKPSAGGSSGGGSTEVTSIVPEKTEVTLKKGKYTTVGIETTASSLTVEVEDEDVISASLSGKTLTIEGLKRGESAIWLRTSGNYASINVTVTAASTGGGGGGSSSSSKEEPTEKPTEKPTEEPTEEPTEQPTEEPTEEPTEPETEPVNPFEDIESHWAKESILTLYKKGVINGMDEDTFAPDDFVTRAQFVTMLKKAFNLTSLTTTSPFKDVDRDDWFFDSVIAAYDNKITMGDTENNFNPSNLVTRQDMAVFAYRTITAYGKGISFNPNTKVFSDHNMIKDYAVEAVYAMKSVGIINGMTDTTFEPLGNATRAQAAHIIAKLLEL